MPRAVSKRVREGPPSGESSAAGEDGENRAVRRSTRERSAVQRFVAGPAHGDSHSYETARFHLVPPNGWHRFVWKMGCQALNTLKYSGELPPPTAPGPCWLLPSSDDMAQRIADIQPQLVAAGWKILTSEPELVFKLSNKVSFREYSESIGLAEYLPVHYASIDAATYPAVLKQLV